MANTDFCGSTGGNTGAPRCDVKLETPTGILFVPRDTVVTATDADDLLGFIQGKAREDSTMLRWYPILGIEQITDSSEEPVTGNLAATGYSEKLRDGASIYLFEYPARLCRAKALKQFDQWDGGAYLITSDKKLWGRMQKDGSLAPYLPSSVSVYGGGFSDGQNIVTSKLNVNMGPQGKFIEQSGFFGFEVDDDIDAIIGLQTVFLNPVGANQYQVITKCDRTNLFDLYNTELADDTLWEVTEAASGATTTITSVSANAANKSFTVVFTAPTGKYYVSLAKVSVLENKGVVGYESELLSVKP